MPADLRALMDAREAAPPGSTAWHEADLEVYRAIMAPPPALPRDFLLLEPEEGLVEDVQRVVRGLEAVCLARGISSEQSRAYAQTLAYEVAESIAWAAQLIAAKGDARA